MNNFNSVFQQVKINIGEGVKYKTTMVRKIASGTGLNIERVGFYLDCLEHLGIVRYDDKDTISLTPKGKAHETIFL